MDITIRYIYILSDEALDMLYALKARTIGKSFKKYSSLSSILGSLFIKSKELGDETYAAMECRGFTGEYRTKVDMKLKGVDYVYILMNVVWIILFILIM
jgi:cobalt/nickel transport system permease protein